MAFRNILALIPAIAASALVFAAANPPAVPPPPLHEIVLQSGAVAHPPRPPGPVPFPPIKDLHSLTITLARGPCFGPCPIYSVEIRGDGTVTYTGERFVLLDGRHVTKIGEDKIRALFEAFRKADFFRLYDSYVAHITDNPATLVTLAYDGHKKSVLDYVGRSVGMPPEVTALQDRIDDIAGTATWITGDARTVAALKAEGWNFKAARNGRMLAAVAERGTDEAMLGLLGEGVRAHGAYGCSAAASAARRGRLAVLRALLQAGAPLYASSTPAEQWHGGDACDVLMSAAEQGMPEVIAAVLAHHPDVNRCGERGWTPLLALGAAGGEPPLPDLARSARLLLEAGADPHVKSSNGQTARDVARFNARHALEAVLDDWVAKHPRRR